MNRYKATPEQEAWAYKQAVKGYDSKHTSLDTGLPGAFVGYLAETMVMDMLRLPRKENPGKNDQGYDFEYNGKKWDVKTVTVRGDPRPHWTMNVNAAQVHNASDAYIFCTFNRFTRTLTIVGWQEKKTAMAAATFHEEGTTIKNDSGEMTVKSAMFCIPTSTLKPFNNEHGWNITGQRVHT